jgi:glycosyltransferase involved in cell wall biosynthesis
MKVLHAYNAHRHGGGSDNAWSETIRLSREAGLEVEVFARDSRDLSPGLAGKARAFGSGLYAREAVEDFARALAAFKPDLVHTHELYPLISPWILRRCRAAGTPVVHSCYDYRLTCPVATHYRRGEICDRCLGGREYQAVLQNCRGSLPESLAYALRNAVARKARLFEDNVDHFLVLAEDGRRWLERELGVAPERITVNACAIALPETAADAGAGEYVAYAGRFVPEKGVEVLIEAARRTGLPVRLAGNAASHPAIRAGDPVECVLTPTRADLLAFYRGARMLVVPSLWREAFGIVAGEAMSHGVPVVASRIGGLADVIVDGVSGIAVEPGDVHQLAETMRRLWNDTDLRRRLGAAARRRAQTEFSGEAHMARLTGAYRQALDGYQRSPSSTRS